MRAAVRGVDGGVEEDSPRDLALARVVEELGDDSGLTNDEIVAAVDGKLTLFEQYSSAGEVNVDTLVRSVLELLESRIVYKAYLVFAEEHGFDPVDEGAFNKPTDRQVYHRPQNFAASTPRDMFEEICRQDLRVGDWVVFKIRSGIDYENVRERDLARLRAVKAQYEVTGFNHDGTIRVRELRGRTGEGRGRVAYEDGSVRVSPFFYYKLGRVVHQRSQAAIEAEIAAVNGAIEVCCGLEDFGFIREEEVRLENRLVELEDELSRILDPDADTDAVKVIGKESFTHVLDYLPDLPIVSTNFDFPDGQKELERHRERLKIFLQQLEAITDCLRNPANIHESWGENFDRQLAIGRYAKNLRAYLGDVASRIRGQIAEVTGAIAGANAERIVSPEDPS